MEIPAVLLLYPLPWTIGEDIRDFFHSSWNTWFNFFLFLFEPAWTSSIRLTRGELILILYLDITSTAQKAKANLAWRWLGLSFPITIPQCTFVTFSDKDWYISTSITSPDLKWGSFHSQASWIQSFSSHSIYWIRAFPRNLVGLMYLAIPSFPIL